MILTDEEIEKEARARCSRYIKDGCHGASVFQFRLFDVIDFANAIAARQREIDARICDARYMGDNNREDMEARRCAQAIRNQEV